MIELTKNNTNFKAISLMAKRSMKQAKNDYRAHIRFLFVIDGYMLLTDGRVLVSALTDVPDGVYEANKANTKVVQLLNSDASIAEFPPTSDIIQYDYDDTTTMTSYRGHFTAKVCLMSGILLDSDLMCFAHDIVDGENCELTVSWCEYNKPIKFRNPYSTVTVFVMPLRK